MLVQIIKKMTKLDKPLVLRLKGNNMVEARKILEEIEHEVQIHMCDEMDEAVEVAVELAK